MKSKLDILHMEIGLSDRSRVMMGNAVQCDILDACSDLLERMASSLGQGEVVTQEALMHLSAQYCYQALQVRMKIANTIASNSAKAEAMMGITAARIAQFGPSPDGASR